jgi:murein DD-endopeptidase MepM/ murein hydrolase activator NlpD
MKKIAVLLVGLLVVALSILLFISSRSTLKFEPAVRFIGANTPVKVQIANPHGVRRITAALEQDGKRYPIFEQTQPSARLTFFGKQRPATEITFNAGKDKAPSLHSGKARLLVSAVSNDLRGAEDSLASDVEVTLEPPRVTADGVQHYINQGGSELVTFQASGYWTEAGVRCGDYSFRSFPMPGQDAASGQRFSIFGYPWNVPAGTECVVFVKNPAGAEATAKFWQKLFPKKFRVRDLEVSDSFLQKVVPDIDPSGSGPLIDRFLKINSETRKLNNKTLSDLRFKSAEKVLWSGPFLQLGNSKVESLFADTRNYMYDGKKVDQQTHLGFDLSVTKNVPVAAGNSGVVVLAERLGIYGNCIVIDHGYGLQSIYGHLSEISVKPGDSVKQGQIIGKSGATGLAGGDHLHFSMQLDGVQVNPVEWWDSHWIQDRILSKLPVQ